VFVPSTRVLSLSDLRDGKAPRGAVNESPIFRTPFFFYAPLTSQRRCWVGGGTNRGQRAKAHVAFGRSFVPVHPHRTVYELRRNGGRVAPDIPHAVAGGLCFCRVALGTTPNWHPGPSGSADVAQKSRPKFKAVLVRGRLNLTPQPMNNSYAKG
jgi:hypothetical protein